MKYIVMVLAMFSIFGCASQVPKLVDDLNTTAPCCTSLGELNFPPFSPDPEHLFSIGPGDRVFNFSFGKSYVKGFEMPDLAGKYSMEVRTYLVGDWIPTAHVFGPYIRFLDAERQILGQEVFPQLFLDKGFFEGPRWTGVVQIPLNAKYVVFYTKPELINTRISLGSTDGYAYATGTGIVFVPPSGERSSSFGPAGELRIRFLSNVR